MHINDVGCRTATVFDKWNRSLKNCLPARRGKGPYKRLNPNGTFAESSILAKGELYAHVSLTAGFYGVCPALSGK